MIVRVRNLIFLFIAVGLVAYTGPAPSSADLVLTNASILTMDENRPRAEALAIRGDRIVAIGTHADVQPWTGPGTRVADLGGRTVDLTP